MTNLSVESVPKQLHEALHPLYERAMVDGCLLCGEREAKAQNHLSPARPEPALPEKGDNRVTLLAWCC